MVPPDLDPFFPPREKYSLAERLAAVYDPTRTAPAVWTGGGKGGGVGRGRPTTSEPGGGRPAASDIEKTATVSEPGSRFVASDGGGGSSGAGGNVPQPVEVSHAAKRNQLMGIPRPNPNVATLAMEVHSGWNAVLLDSTHAWSITCADARDVIGSLGGMETFLPLLRAHFDEKYVG